MAQLFTPPQRIETVQMAGSLRYSYPVSLTVWKDGDGWHSQETPPDEVLAAAVVRWAGTPRVVPDDVAAELIEAGIGTCVPIEP